MKKVLGIETSCDDTAVAIVNEEGNIIFHTVYSQLEEHKIFGGVVPEIASRNHLKCLPHAIQKIGKSFFAEVDAIAVTAGPGLIGGLIVGVMFAKSLGYYLKKPVLPINHLEGHLLTTRLTHRTPFPFLALLISGGHCQFVLAESLGNYKILGRTLDDAAGEAFDKVGKMMGLEYPAGPEIERRAKQGDHTRFNFPTPLLKEQNCNFSFSGLKTAVNRQIMTFSSLNEQTINDICASFQETMTVILEKKLNNAIAIAKTYLNALPLKNLVLCGGVAANLYIAQRLQQIAHKHNMILDFPPTSLCTDNAAMIAWAGLEQMKKNLYTINNVAANVVPRSNWNLEDIKCSDNY